MPPPAQAAEPSPVAGGFAAQFLLSGGSRAATSTAPTMAFAVNVAELPVWCLAVLLAGSSAQIHRAVTTCNRIFSI